MFEPIIKTDISMLPKSIETNLADLEPFIWDKVDSANRLVVDATSIEDCERAEADAALLTKMAKKIAEFRLTWTKVWQSPFESVIAKCKDYESRLKAAGEDLRGKAKVGRDRVRQDKYNRLKVVWIERCMSRLAISEEEANNGHFASFFDHMCDEKTTGCWTNRGKSDSKVIAEMDAELGRCDVARNAVREMFSRDEQDIQVIATDALKAHYDVSETVSAVNAYRDQRRKISEARTKVEPVAPVAPKQESTPERVLVGDEPVLTYVLKVTGTRKALTALRAYGEAHGVSFARVSN